MVLLLVLDLVFVFLIVLDFVLVLLLVLDLFLALKVKGNTLGLALRLGFVLGITVFLVLVLV